MNLTLIDVVKLLLSVFLGGLIGAEREYHDKTAGFRTIILICVGATLFTMFSAKIGGENDPRISANIVSGVGFLGAGVILRAGGRIVGLTTASMIWLSAAIGMGIGAGHYLFTGVTTAIVICILWIFPAVENWIDKMRDFRAYEVVCENQLNKLKDIEEIFQTAGVTVKKNKQCKNKDQQLVCTFFTYGKPYDHEQAINKLLENHDVKAFDY